MNAVPSAVREAARRAFDARPQDALVADLIFDSLLDGDRRAAANPAVRKLRFGRSGGGADLVVTENGATVNVVVQVLPPQRALAEVRSKAPTFTVGTDTAGRTAFDVLPGLFSLVLRPLRSPRPEALQTAWVRL